MGRRRGRRAPFTNGGPAPAESGGETGGETEEGDETDDQQETSLVDLQAPADPQTFDRTFLAQKENFRIEGNFSPAPFPLQVLPRVAYTINYQMVYNENQDRWEPQKKSEGGGSSFVGTRTAFKASNALADGQVHDIRLYLAVFAEGITVDTTANEIIVEEDGLYQLSAQIRLTDYPEDGKVVPILSAAGSQTVTKTKNLPRNQLNGAGVTIGLQGSAELVAGDAIEAQIFNSTDGSIELGLSREEHFIEVLRIGT